MAGNLCLSQALLVLVTLGGLFQGVVSTTTSHQHAPVMHTDYEEYSDESYPESSQNVITNHHNMATIMQDPDMGPLQATEFDVKYILYKGNDNGQTFTYDNFESSKVNFITGAPLKVLIHGFLNNGKTSFPLNILNAYIQRTKNHPDEQFNVLVYDWGKGACASVSNILKPYGNAAENVEKAGHKLGDMLVKLHNMNLMNVSSEVHLIGHSLGSHVAGQAARRVFDKLGRILNRVSALDPAGPYFWRNRIFLGKNQPYPRLHRNRVHFLDVYHTSLAFGSNEEMGDVDFFINDGKHQDSCNIEMKIPFLPIRIPIVPSVFKTFLQVCSHNYATDIYAKSINDETMLGCTGCYSYWEFSRGKCECEDRPIMGEFVVKETMEGYPIASGLAFVRTPKDTSSGSNYLQMLWNNGIFRLLWKGWEALCL